MVAQFDGIAVFNLIEALGHPIETLHHLERFLVAYNLNLWIIFLNECEATTVVWLHVIHHEVVDLAISDYLLDIFQILYKEIYFDGINQTHFLIINEIRIIRYTIGQRPQTLKQVLVTVIHPYIVDFVDNFFHYFIFLDCSSW